MKLRSTQDHIASTLTRTPAAVTLAGVAVIAIAGCSGGSGSGGTPQPLNAAPQLTGVGSQMIDQDTSTAALPLTVSDDGGADNVMLTASASDGSIIPLGGIVFGGSGANRTLTLTPAEDATGQVNVSVTATDAQGLSATVTFPLSVRAVTQSFTSYANATFGQMENDDPAKVSGFTFVQDADDESTFDPLLQ